MTLRLLLRPLTTRVESSFGADHLPGEQYTEPAGDPGLFGPGSIVWRVHADPSMMVGGVSGLMLGALHPLPLAGTMDFSSFATDPFGRLGRTVSFVTATTYGATPVAERMIDTVRRMHTRVQGTAPNGEHYDATDPELVTWIHVTQAYSYVRANQRYALRPLLPWEADRYYREASVVAVRLGARAVPESRAEVADYLQTMRPELVVTDQTRDALRFLRTPGNVDPATRLAGRILADAAFTLLPAWAANMLGAPPWAPVQRLAVHPPAWWLLEGIRLAMGRPQPLRQAEARCAR